ncbi:MAG: hypothetical protein KA116_07640 [Proteobacteria bacterium]|nr:hypothetical protein [Pseudomonadota bacterium]
MNSKSDLNKFYFIFVLYLSYSQAIFSAEPHFVTPKELAETATMIVHPLTRARSCEEIIVDLKTVGRNIGTASALTKLLYGHATKVFHNHSIGSAFVRFELMPTRPEFLRQGMFSDAIPSVSYGFANFTTGRSTPNPPHLKPDVTGLTVVLNMNQKPVVLTTTASKGAFGDTGKQFSELAWFPTIMSSVLSGYSKEDLMNTQKADWKWDEKKSKSLRVNLGSILGEALGEGIFIARNPKPALGTLLPAILSGRFSPFFGYRGVLGLGDNIGFGSGHAFLLESLSPEKLDPVKNIGISRTAFRFGFRIVDSPVNRALIENEPGLLKTLDRVIGTGWNKADSRYLSTEFKKWNQAGPIEYEMYVQLEDKTHPENTPIEATHRRWKSEKIPVARMTLLPVKTGADEVLNDFINKIPANPGLGFHRPLGVLALDRSMGPVVSREGLNAGSGAYSQSSALRGALGVDLQRFQVEAIIEKINSLPELMRSLGYELESQN